MRRGGPDGEGIWMNDEANLVLGHRRLSILDLSEAGAQPMQTDAACLVYNGEIYNFSKIRQQLINLGFEFKSNSDTEVVLKAYMQWGVESFKLFNGIYAFAIYDKKQKLLFIVRSPNSVKPIYYFESKSAFIFASELRAFFNLPFQFKEFTHWKSLFLLYGFVPEPYTLFEGVKMLKNGTYLKYDLIKKDSIQIDFRYQPEHTIDSADFRSVVRKQILDAVNRQLVSDAPFGVFLSGGLDSSIITFCAANQPHLKPKTLSINFIEDGFSEKVFQQLVVEKFGTEHFEANITYHDFEESFEDILDSLDRPSVDGINTYFISKFAHQVGLKMVLSGIGADEAFGGYPSFKENSLVNLASKLPSFCAILSVLFSDLRFKKLEFLNIKNPIKDYLMQRAIYPPSEICKILQISPQKIQQAIELTYLPISVEKKSNFSKFQWLESTIYMQNQLLKDSDFMGMWNSIEIRVPFLDDELLHLIHAIPESAMWNHHPKSLLIEAFRSDLPKEVWDRPKMGFSFPFKTWMKKYFRENGFGLPADGLDQYFRKFEDDKIHWSRFWSLYITKLFEQKLLAHYQQSSLAVD